MFRRSNKRGPTVPPQMMRGDESQSALLQDAEEDRGAAASNDLNPSGGDDGEIGEAAAGVMGDGVLTRTAGLPCTGRVRRVPVSAFRCTPALGRMTEAVGAVESTWLTTRSTVRIVARFERSASSAVQHLCGTRSFAGKLWYSFVRN